MFKRQSCHLHLGELFIGGEAISRVGEGCKEKSFKFLGHHLDENLTWNYHVNHVHKKLVSANFALSRSKAFLPPKVLKTIYRSLFESHLHFGSIVWGCAKSQSLHKLEVQQKKAIRHVKNLRYNSHTGDHFKQLEYLQIRDLISFNQAMFARKYIPMASCLLPSIACSLQFLSRVAEGSGMTIIISFQCQYPMLTCTTFPLNR